MLMKWKNSGQQFDEGEFLLGCPLLIHEDIAPIIMRLMLIESNWRHFLAWRFVWIALESSFSVQPSCTTMLQQRSLLHGIYVCTRLPDCLTIGNLAQWMRRFDRSAWSTLIRAIKRIIPAVIPIVVCLRGCTFVCCRIDNHLVVTWNPAQIS